VTVPGASHFVHIDQADDYNRAMIAFFDQIGER
jgi:pimeloyl-ACP methyl ester carboxylesterase